MEASKWFRVAANSGDPKADDILGALYSSPFNIKADPAEAAKWYQKAFEIWRTRATKGDPEAQLQIGYKYINGQGVKPDISQALIWLRKSAEQGNTSAQRQLGALYAEGSKVQKDVVEAMRWYRMAADQGDRLGQQKYSELDERLHAAFKDDLCSIREGGSEIRYHPRSETLTPLAEKGDAKAQTQLAELYFNGMGVKQSYAEAYFWAMLAMNNTPSPSRPPRCDTMSILNRSARHLTLSEIATLQPRLRVWKLTPAPAKAETK